MYISAYVCTPDTVIISSPVEAPEKNKTHLQGDLGKIQRPNVHKTTS